MMAGRRPPGGLVLGLGVGRRGEAWREDHSPLRRHADDAVAEHVFKGLTDIVYADQARAAGMNTHHIFIIGPAGHEPLNIAFLQGFIKRGFDLVG